MQGVSQAARSALFHHALQFAPKAMVAATRATGKLIDGPSPVSKLTQQLVKPWISQFLIGQTPTEAAQNARAYQDQTGIKVCVDPAAEMVSTAEGRHAAFTEALDLLSTLSAYGHRYMPIKLTALFNPDTLKKRSAGQALSPEEQIEYQTESTRFFELIDAAKTEGIRILIDQEYPEYAHEVHALSLQASLHANQSSPVVYETIQCITTCGPGFLRDSAEQLVRHRCFPAFKIVLGTYESSLFGRRTGITRQNKLDTVTAFGHVVRYLPTLPEVSTIIASHNPGLVAFARDRLTPEYTRYAQLYGYYAWKNPDLAYALSGSLRDAFAYFSRRASEATAPCPTAKDMRQNFSHYQTCGTLGTHLQLTEIRQLRGAAATPLQPLRASLSRSTVIQTVFRFDRSGPNPKTYPARLKDL